MLDAESLDDLLLDALQHLYDPDYEPPAELYKLMRCNPEAGAMPVQTALIQEITALEPHDDLPSNAHLRRVHEVMHNRFALKLTQEKTAELMDISVRHLNRVQREAVHTLAQRIWERRQSGLLRAQGRPNQPEATGSRDDLQAQDWQSQTQRELASLQASEPRAICNIAQMIDGALDVHRALRNTRNVAAKTAFVQPGLVAAAHPAILRQLLISTMGRLSRYRHSEPLTIFAGLESDKIRITLTAALIADPLPTKSDLIDGLLVPDETTLEAQFEANHVFLTIRVPSAQEKTTVLVVDDNADMAHFYQRASMGTRYHIVHVENGRDLLNVVTSVKPDVIVLDVMLPDIDGWQLLMQLHENRATRPIPVIVCTVIREEELALSLGAAELLSKPVRPREFIQALDRVYAQAATSEPTAPESSE